MSRFYNRLLPAGRIAGKLRSIFYFLRTNLPVKWRCHLFYPAGKVVADVGVRYRLLSAGRVAGKSSSYLLLSADEIAGGVEHFYLLLPADEFAR